MVVFLHELSSWPEVERVAASPGIVTCIRGGETDVGLNHDKAEKVWQEHHPRTVRYFAQIDGDRYETIGYVRVSRVMENEYTTPQVWCIDFAKPLDYQAVLALAQQLSPAVLLVKKSEGINTKHTGLTAHWPTVAAAYPQLDKYGYRIQGPQESGWLVVPR